MRWVLAVLVLLSGAACAAPASGPGRAGAVDEPCGGKCDAHTVGPMTLSTRWTPRGGFVRVLLDADHGLLVPDGASAWQQRPGRWVVDFGDEGFFDLSATRNGAVVATARVRVSDEGPDLALESPTIGAHVEAAPGDRLRVLGTVLDPLGEPLNVTFGGWPVELGAGGVLDVTIDAAFGLQVLDIRAMDLAGNEFRFSPSFLAAPRFSWEPSRNLIRFDQPTLDRLAQRLSGRLPELFELAARGEVEHSTSIDISFEGATLAAQGDLPGEMRLSFEPRGDRIHVTYDVLGRSEGRFRANHLLYPEIDMRLLMDDIHAEMDVWVSEGGADGPVLTGGNATLSDAGMTIELDWAPDWVARWSKDTLRRRIREALEAEIPPLIEDILRTAESDAQVPGVAGGPESTLHYRLMDIDVDAEGGLIVELDARMERQTAAATVPAPPRFPIVAPPRYPGSLAVRRDGELGVTFSYDVLNQWLYDQWANGALTWTLNEGDLGQASGGTLSLTGLLEDAMVDVRVRSDLPPVASPGPDGLLRVSVGEVRVDARVSTDLMHASATATFAAHVDFSVRVEDGVMRLTPEETDFAVDFDRVGLSALDTEAMEEVLRAAVPPVLERHAARLASVPLPDFDLAPIGVSGVLLRLGDAVGRSPAEGLMISGSVSFLEPPSEH